MQSVAKQLLSDAMPASAHRRAEPLNVRVPASSLAPFEPVGLGSLRPRFGGVVRNFRGMKQTAIIDLLSAEVEAMNGSEGLETAAYKVALLVLRDYARGGYYPVATPDGRCFLAPIFSAETTSPAVRRRFLQASYVANRNRSLRERGVDRWLRKALGDLRASGGYDVASVIERLREEPPRLALMRATASSRSLDARTLWRCVRSTWSMKPEASAPGREVAFIAVDQRWPQVPLGILQFRNVLPEIEARDAWLGVSVGNLESGFIGSVSRIPIDDAVERLRATRQTMLNLLSCVRRDGLPVSEFDVADVERLRAEVAVRKRLYNQARRQGSDDADQHLAVSKRAETSSDLLRGIHVIGRSLDSDDLVAALSANAADLDAGLRKVWHYHMGFVALELSVCGAAPPFGPLRLGKLMAALAGSAEVIDAWGRDRPLGAIATTIYTDDVRKVVPDPGPLVVFTSGLYPGHSAQYNRVRSGEAAWVRIGQTAGWGSFHVSAETTAAIDDFNIQVDGYAHITKRFGEGAGARFRSIGRALDRLSLPDLRQHQTRRPLYALALDPRPHEVIYGWRPVTQRDASAASDIVSDWWSRWLHPRSDDLVAKAYDSPSLIAVLEDLIANVEITSDEAAA